MLLLHTLKATVMPEWSCLPAQTGCPSSSTVPVKVPVRESVGDLEQEKTANKKIKKVHELHKLMVHE